MFSIWMPYKLRNSNLDNLINDFTRNVVKTLPWDQNVPSQSSEIACIYLDSSTKTLWDSNCDSLAPSICKTYPAVNFKLLGLCSDTFMDDIYILKDFNGLTLYGDKTVSIKFDESSAQWTALTKDGTLLATIKASKSSLLLGTHNWTIYNDSLDCQLLYKGNPYTLPLNLNSCNDEEFNCDDGSCISLAKKCNGVSNCQDSSDEFQCSKILMERTYSKYIPPPPNKNDNAIYSTINIDLDIMEIIEIVEVKGTITIKLNLTAEWYDKRVKFSNLKNETRLNKLEDYESNYLWKPDILYMNIISNEDREIFGQSKSYIERSKIVPPLYADDKTVLNRVQTFSGAHSKIIFYETSRKDYFKKHKYKATDINTRFSSQTQTED